MSSDYYNNTSSVEYIKLSELNMHSVTRLPNTRKEIVKGVTLMRIVGSLQTDARLYDQNLVLLYGQEPLLTDQDSARFCCVYKVLVDITLVKNNAALNLNDLNFKHDLVEFLGYKMADGAFGSLDELVAHGTTIAQNLESWPIGLSCHQEDVSLYPKFKAIFHRYLKRASLSTYYQAIDIQRQFIAKN